MDIEEGINENKIIENIYDERLIPLHLKILLKTIIISLNHKLA